MFITFEEGSKRREENFLGHVFQKITLHIMSGYIRDRVQLLFIVRHRTKTQIYHLISIFCSKIFRSLP